MPITNDITFLVLILAVAGALGMAFLKESKHYSKKVQEVSLEYMQGRIRKSEVVTEDVKRKHLDLLHEKPYRAFKI
ncbi:DUF5392 family protein, partial [Pseudomonas sp. 2822-17]|uniref:DUF5392 family protein n=1 Tax=Pseudomonas sp. 2822-17 TaxID=1712678 RepID=UPI000C46E38E